MIGSALFAQVTTECPYLYNVRPCLIKCLFPLGYLNLHLAVGFFEPIRAHNPKQHLHRFSRLCRADRSVVLYFTMGCPFPPPSKLLLPMWGIWTPYLIHGSLGPPKSSTQTASGLFSRFTGLASVTDRSTDHATRLVTICRIYVRSTAMRPKK